MTHLGSITHHHSIKTPKRVNAEHSQTPEQANASSFATMRLPFSLPPEQSIQAAHNIVNLLKKLLKTPSREVHAVANRMPLILSPGERAKPRDYVILGMEDSYPSKVLSLSLKGETKAVTRENKALFVRGLDFTQPGVICADLNLEDGSALPLEIHVQFVY